MEERKEWVMACGREGAAPERHSKHTDTPLYPRQKRVKENVYVRLAGNNKREEERVESETRGDRRKKEKQKGEKEQGRETGRREKKQEA